MQIKTMKYHHTLQDGYNQNNRKEGGMTPRGWQMLNCHQALTVASVAHAEARLWPWQEGLPDASWGSVEQEQNGGWARTMGRVVG